MESPRACKGPCGRSLAPTEENFFFRKSSKNGKSYPSSYCRPCEREKSAKSRKARYATAEGKLVIDSSNATYRAKPEKALAISSRLKWRYDNDSDYRAERLANASMWRKNNRTRRKFLGARWYQKHKNRLRREWNARFKADPIFRLRNNFRRAVWEALRSSGGDKAGRSVLVYLPYTMEELHAHLESLWEPWMDWDNYGCLETHRRTWQIDHVVPQARLPFMDFSDSNFLVCWALSNLRPLESSLNVSKGCR